MYDPYTGVSYPDASNPIPNYPEYPSLYGPPDDYWGEEDDELDGAKEDEGLE